MLIKNHSYLFKAFRQYGENDFFLLLKYNNLFLFRFIIYYLYIKRANPFKQQLFWFVQLALFHRTQFFFFFL